MAEVLSLTQFRKKNPLKKGSDELKYVTELFKPLKTEKVNISKPTAFRAGDVVSASGIYKIKLGIDLYKLVRAKVTGSSARPKKGQQKPKTVFITTSDEIEFAEVKPDKELEIYFFNGNGKGREVRLTQTDAPWKDTKGKKAPMSTNQQELISMKIIEEVASGNTPNYNNFAEMYKDKNSGLKKIHSNLTNVDPEWWNHFVLQFNEVRKILKKNDLIAKYNTFSQDEKGTGFMAFIKNLVTKGTESESKTFIEGPLGQKLYTKKDSWNPADIWLIRKGVSGKRFTLENKKTPGIKQQLQQAGTIKIVNEILRYAFQQKIIVGISLKKSDQKTLKFELVNLHTKVSTDILKSIEYDGIKFNCSTVSGGGKFGFKSLTSNLLLSQGGREYRLDFRSNQGGLVDITYDFMEQGAPASLGKVPKDRLKTYVNTYTGGKIKDFPHYTDYNEFGKLVDWEKKVKTINDSGLRSSKFPWLEWEDFAKNMQKSWKKSAGAKTKYTNKGKHNISMMQMFDFIHILAVIDGKNGKNRKKLIECLTDLFYFAQKKGMKWHFGPFGKLY